MTRAEAPSDQPAVAGGTKDKARTGISPEKVTSAGRGGPLTPGNWTWLRFREPRAGGSNPPRGAFVPFRRVTRLKQWTSERANARKPATYARLGVSIAPMKAITVYHWSGSLEEPAMNTLSQVKKIQVLNALTERRLQYPQYRTHDRDTPRYHHALGD